MSIWDECKMDWPLERAWQCPYCGGRDLWWGFVHGQCRCWTCHALFTMLEPGTTKRVTKPFDLFKPEYARAFALIWKKGRLPSDTITDERWDSALKAVSEKVSDD